MTPIFQTSANRSGAARADAASTIVDPAILGEVDLAIDAGELIGEPSTVVDVTDDRRRGQLADPAGGGAGRLRGRPPPRRLSELAASSAASWASSWLE